MASKFERVANNQEKSNAYKIQMDRFKQARAQGFYLEGVFILYAMLEDRLSSFLFHAGVINGTRDRITSNKHIKPCLDEMLTGLEKKNRNIVIISNKILIIQTILKWSMRPDDFSTNEKSKEYLCILYRQINKSTGKDEILLTLDKIRGWCQARNELVHALLTKNPAHQEESLKLLLEEGYTLTRKLDNFVRSFKVRNTIRKQFNIQ